MQEFQEIVNKLNFDLKQIDKIILECAHGKSPLIEEISHHLIKSGGKRIRPILLLISGKLCNLENDQRIYNLASAVELIHSATLLHDDVVDNSQVRRGKKTASALWDNKFSILVGDYLFATAFDLMVKSNSLKALELLSKTSAIIVDGEVMQLENSSDLSITIDKYFEIIFCKTAVLFSASCEVAGVIGEVKDFELLALKNFGKNLGIVFQIVDDILDYSSNQKNLGKEIGNDFFEGKVTLPMIYTFQNANNVEKEFIKKKFAENLQNKEKNHQDFMQILDLINKYNAIQYCKDMAFEYCDNAQQDLLIFEDSPYYQDLTDILNYSLERIS